MTQVRFTVRHRRLLMQRIQELGSTEHEEIFKILQRNNVNHTQNNNGVFVNLSSVDDDVVEQVQRFVDFCFHNNHELDEYDKRINECKISQNYDRFMGLAPHADAPADAPADLSVPTPDLETAPAPSEPTPSAGPPGTQAVVLQTGVQTGGGGQTGQTGGGPPAVVASVAKRIMNSKFHQATKRFAKKKVVPGDKGGGGLDASTNELVPEAYPCL